MPKKVRKLYERCWGCEGTRKTLTDFQRNRGGVLPAGSDCPLCEDGYFETGLSLGQVERLVEQKLKQQMEQCSRKPVPDLLALLKAMWEWQKTCQELLPDDLAEKVEAAIAKAEGRA